MTTFDDREAAYEAKFVHDAELEFLAQASRNKHIAFWAAALMGMSAEEAVRYAKDIIRIDLEAGGEAAVIKKLLADLGDLRPEARVRQLMGEFLAEAREKAARGELRSVL
ncbi:DUF1476 domain-containing protein [Tropicimonas sp. IMCC6043]|uniref:DUF1476 domain-containing protein n=1 Tax=Tropicimonas sp. IMCC6043 TaxID=2510645 RepID=UPI00101CDA6A|nr:DUF1476 domain-containing protein [Tropicimonas sp. IMCC6043]RYH12136.1 DUF1476 domain-containing protein [Tropicimonas sp. IMCC6043]